MHEYFVKIVPTSYEHYKAEVISSNQYSATQYFRYAFFSLIYCRTQKPRKLAKPPTISLSMSFLFRPGDPAVDARVLPGVFFYYEMSPIKVVVREYVSLPLIFFTDRFFRKACRWCRFSIYFCLGRLFERT